MATINYTTLQLPQILFDYSEKIQNLPYFEVRRYKHAKGIIFRLPHGAEVGQTFHAFMEHEINMTNTLKTGTLTMKVQVTFIPCHMGVFSGFARLNGSYDAERYDEWGYDMETFVPDYKHPDNAKNIVPLPPNFKTNLWEYLNHILFNHVSDADIISKYAVDLGCKKEELQDTLVPLPVKTSHTNAGIAAFHQTIDFFQSITSGVGGNLIGSTTVNDPGTTNAAE